MQTEGTIHELQPMAAIRLMDGTGVHVPVEFLTHQTNGIRVWMDASRKHSVFYPYFNVLSVTT